MYTGRTRAKFNAVDVFLSLAQQMQLDTPPLCSSMKTCHADRSSTEKKRGSRKNDGFQRLCKRFVTLFHDMLGKRQSMWYVRNNHYRCRRRKKRREKLQLELKERVVGAFSPTTLGLTNKG